MTPEDEATAHLLVAAAFHDAAVRADERGDVLAGNFARAASRDFEDSPELYGLEAIVMKYALASATPEDVAALQRWIDEVTGP